MILTVVQTDLRSVWTLLPPLNKLFALFFFGVSLYTLALSAEALRAIHSFRKGETEPTKMVTLLHRFSNLRQLHLLTLYVFGFCIAMQIPSVFYTVNDSYEHQGVRGLVFLFRFDATVFFAFALLHIVQWVVSAKLHAIRKH
jgi:hypothetical protein